jgi:hypothetical protein
MTPQPDLDAIHRLDRARWSAPAMAEAEAACGRWGLAVQAVVGAAAVPRDGLSSGALHRAGALFGIDHALAVVLGADQGLAWLHAPNAGLAGRAPAMAMEKGGLVGLLAVRSVLDAWKAGLFGARDPAQEAPLVVLRVIG